MRVYDEHVKAITHVPGWLENTGASGTDRVSGTSSAYALVPLIFRAVRLRCDAISSVPIHLYSLRGGTETAWPFATPLADLIWRTEAALLLTGGAYWLKLDNKVRTTDIQWLNPYSMEVRYQNGQVIFAQSESAPNTGPWQTKQMVYFREFGVADDITPGVSSAQVALEDARLLRYLTRFAAHYFDNGAMPVTLLGFEMTPTQAEVERVQTWFRRMASGIGNAWRVLGLRGKIDPKILTPVPKDLEMPALNNQARHNVAMAFGIPQTMLEDAANYATAGEHRLSFWQDTVRPRGRIYEDVINQQLLNPMGFRIHFDFEEMGIFQVDEAQRAGALLNLVQSGLDTLSALEILGYQLSEEQISRMQRDSASTEAAREDAQDETEMLDEVRRWERKALKRVKAGRPAQCEFQSRVIPPGLAGAIEGALGTVQSDAMMVRAVFADVTSAYLESNGTI